MIKIPYNKDKQRQVFKRYHDKAYKRYNLTLHTTQHKGEIDYIESEKAKGNSPTKTMLKLIRKEITKKP